MNRKWLGNRIRDARERRHLTQEKLSEMASLRWRCHTADQEETAGPDNPNG